MPFRLLAVLAHPEDDALVCRRTLRRYAMDGVESTIVWAAARDELSGGGAVAAARSAGAHDLLTLDFGRGELAGLEAGALESVLADIYRSLTPHVVLTFGPDGVDGDGDHVALHHAAGRAFRLERRRAKGSAVPPLRLYHAVAGSAPAQMLATTIVEETAGRELFARAYPQPWVTGVIERDLFGGLALRSDELDLERLAS